MKKIFSYIGNLLRYIKYGGLVNISITKLSPASILEGKVILITGGGSGFGLQMAKDFVAQGAKVIITGRSIQKLEHAIKIIGSDNVKVLEWDVSDISKVNERLDLAIALFGRIDIFINNAGVWKGISWSTVSEADYDYIVDINTKGLYFICQSELKYFIGQNIFGKIINITSVEGNRSSFLPYNVSKWGANCITKGLAQEAIKKGVIVNAIAPGVAITEINPELKRTFVDNYYYPGHKSGRYTAVEEISNLALFLASDQANNIIGQVIAVDGGWTLM